MKLSRDASRDELTNSFLELLPKDVELKIRAKIGKPIEDGFCDIRLLAYVWGR
ncbi:MAG: hypothetical protein R3C03_08385 [Pirellulaceae bacterium]